MKILIYPIRINFTGGLYCFILFLFSCFFTLQASASAIKPLEVNNLHILYLPYLFLPFDSPDISQDKSYTLIFSFYKSSTYYDSSNFDGYGYQGTLDLETTQLKISCIKALNPFLEIRLTAPYIYHGPGYLDPIIENFHHLFVIPAGGLPNGGREYAPNNRFLIFLENPHHRLQLFSTLSAFGDPSAYLKIKLLDDFFRLALQGGLKFPLGNTPFIHSQTFDTGLSLLADLTYKQLYLYGFTGCVYRFGETPYSRLLPQNTPLMPVWGVGIGLKAAENFAILMQVYSEISPYHTGVPRLDRASVLHSFGIRWNYHEIFTLQFSADEDTFNFATSDIAFHLQTEFRF